MTVPFPPPGQQGDEEIADSLEASQELQSGEQVTVEESDAAKTQLPPEAEGETNGGPLGCCLGVTVGLMLSLFLGLIGFGHVVALGLASVSHADLATNIRIATGILGVIGAFVGGYAGWRMGKRIYREYE